MKNSSIQWCTHTYNPWEGCTKVAPECKFCYAEILVDKRFGRARWGKGKPRRRMSANYLKQPIAWNSQAEKDGTRPKVFCLSLGDWLDDEVSIEWLADLLKLIHETPHLDWLLLTKRPENFFVRVLHAGMLLMGYRDGQTENSPSAFAEATEDTIESILGWSKGETFPANVWMGVSAGADQVAALEIPATVRFLSCEPMLHALDTTRAAGFDWIIFGGESGANARLLDVDWIRDGIEFCRKHDIAPFVKQMGANVRGREIDKWVTRLKDSHAGDMAEWPDELRIREFPEPRDVMIL